MDVFSGPEIVVQIPTAGQVADRLHSFANKLSGDKWKEDIVDLVEITRSITERIGEDVELGDEEIATIYMDTTISFTALKRIIEENDATRETRVYHLTSTTGQVITKQDIPEGVVNEMFHDDDRDDDIDEDDEDFIDWTRESLDEFEIKRVQNVNYEIGETGTIDDYKISYSYTFDDDTMHEVGYAMSTDSYFWTPVRLADGQSLERRPIVIPVITEHTIKDELRYIDASYRQLLTEMTIRDLTELASVSKEEHLRRVIGIISLVASGFMK